LLYFK